MTVILAAFSRWVLAGGWRWLVGAAVLVSILLFFRHYQHISEQAARVPDLESQITAMDRQASKIADRLESNARAAGAAEAELSAWQTFSRSTMDMIKDQGRHVAASKNPDCHPSAGDRRMRNEALGRLLGAGQAGTAGGLPTGASTAR